MKKPLLSSDTCLHKYGIPVKENNMVVWDVPEELEFPTFPKKLYCNKDLIKPLSVALKNIIDRKLTHEVKTFDGCFNIRQKRGASVSSLHSWGVAIDINAAWNSFGAAPSMSKELVACFKDAGFDWGGEWTKPDGMHFQLQA